MEKGEQIIKVYLGHGKRQRVEGKRLQRQIELWGFEVINPFDHNARARQLTREWFNAQQASDKKELERLSPLIYRKDKNHIKESDIVVVYYPEESTGSSQEIEIAREQKKSIVILTDMIHPFIYAEVTKILPDPRKTGEGLPQLRKLLEEISGEQNV